MPPQSAWSKADTIGAPAQPSLEGILARERYGDPTAPPVMRAPTWKERVWERFRDAYESVLDNPAMRTVLLASGSSPEQQRARFTEPPPEVTQAIAIVPRAQRAELLARLAPRTLAGDVIDESTIPKVMTALREFVDRNPRIASHFSGVTMQDIGTHMGQFNVPPAIAENISAGLEFAKRAQRPFMHLRLRPDIESQAPDVVRQTVLHEGRGHGGAMLADPSRMLSLYKLSDKVYGYHGNPYERLANVAARPVVNSPEQMAEAVNKNANRRFFETNPQGFAQFSGPFSDVRFEARAQGSQTPNLDAIHALREAAIQIGEKAGITRTPIPGPGPYGPARVR